MEVFEYLRIILANDFFLQKAIREIEARISFAEER
jgi:hypothetical protein